MKKNHIWLWLLIPVLLLAGCSIISEKDGPPRFRRLDPDAIRDAIPRVEPKSRYGNPSSYEVFGKRYYVMSSSRGYVKRGNASWYGKKFHGRRTSSGETYDMYAMTAAHRSLPLPTYVHVTNLDNGRRAIVRVNDRGPFHPSRILDLSYAAAVKLGVDKQGVARVEIRAIDPASSSGWRQTDPPITPTTPAATAAVSAPTTGVAEADQTSIEKKLYLQVGAFSQRENAEHMKVKLNSVVDSDVLISTAPVQEPALYRVQLGPFTDVGQVVKLGNTLPALGFYDTHMRFSP